MAILRPLTCARNVALLCENKTNPLVRASFAYLAAHPHCNTSVYCCFVFAAIFFKICSLRLLSNDKRRGCPNLAKYRSPGKGKTHGEEQKGTNNKTVRRAAKGKAAVLQAVQRKTLPFRLVAANFAFSRAAHLRRPAIFAVAAPLPKKFFDTFWEPCPVD